MPTPNAFNADPAPTTPDPNVTTPVVTEPVTPVLDSLVGEGKKFTSVEALAQGKTEADNFIIKLQEEQAELRVELDKRLSAQEALAEIQKKTETSNENTSQQSEADVSDLVRKTVLELSAEEQAKKNVFEADAVLAEKYGDKRGDVVKQKALELGVEVSFLEEAAAKSPSAFLGMIGESVPAKLPQANVSQGSVNTDALAQINTGVKEDTYQFFNELRRRDPKAYFKPETQNKMLKLAVSNPNFYNS